jgi:hypothetical protein
LRIVQEHFIAAGAEEAEGALRITDFKSEISNLKS